MPTMRRRRHFTKLENQEVSLKRRSPSWKQRLSKIRHMHRVVPPASISSSQSASREDGSTMMYPSPIAVTETHNDDGSDISFDEGSRNFHENDEYDDDDDDDDEQSRRSLLSAWCSDDEEPSLSSELHGLARVHKQFNRRSSTFVTLTTGKSKEYRKMIHMKELKCRRLILEQYAESSIRLDSNRTTHMKTKTKTTSNETEGRKAKSLHQRDTEQQLSSSFSTRIRLELLFEAHHTSEGFWNFLWYCMGHLSFYMLIDTVCLMIREGFDIPENTFHLSLIFGGTLMMRCHGSLWSYLSEISYNLVKFDLHNRLLLGYWDAKSIAWLNPSSSSTTSTITPQLVRWRRNLSDVLGILFFYLVYVGFYFYYEKIWGAYEAILWGKYHSLESFWTQELQESQNISYESCDDLIRLPSSYNFRGVGAQFLCRQMSNPSLPVPSIIFQLLVFTTSLCALQIFGVSLFDQ